MATVIAGAIVLGVVASFLIALVPFFAALLFALIVGSVTALLRGVALLELCETALVLLVVTQLAYGIGLLARTSLAVAFGRRSRRPVEPGDPLRHRSR